jgi:hypothetical protein
LPPAEDGATPPEGEGFAAWLEALIPPEAQVHFANAGRELLTGIEITVDHHLGRRPTPPERRAVRIEID